MQLKPRRHLLQTFASDDRGAVSIEYALIAVIVSIAIIAGAIGVRNSLSSSFSAVASGFSQSGP
ncbi:MAG TPA: Flp family type IVb pilin [Lacipirellulaceae bacterium]|jgi:pilus assembly protein Flp/PilA|nr:Flp family type IVb pilin [Lacipirellulaceae bacterium]